VTKTIRFADRITYATVQHSDLDQSPMMDDPFIHFAAFATGILVAAFLVGFLLFQFGFRAIWCFFVGEATVLLFYYFQIRPTGPYADHALPFIHAFVLPVLLAPLFGGYYFNKHVIVHEPVRSEGEKR
jgi:hypothetical protein